MYHFSLYLYFRFFMFLFFIFWFLIIMNKKNIFLFVSRFIFQISTIHNVLLSFSWNNQHFWFSIQSNVFCCLSFLYIINQIIYKKIIYNQTHHSYDNINQIMYNKTCYMNNLSLTSLKHVFIIETKIIYIWNVIYIWKTKQL